MVGASKTPSLRDARVTDLSPAGGTPLLCDKPPFVNPSVAFMRSRIASSVPNHALRPKRGLPLVVKHPWDGFSFQSRVLQTVQAWFQLVDGSIIDDCAFVLRLSASRFRTRL